ncbi:Putative inner membrane protein [Cronobacter muytjensii 530]|nr:YfgG family protein [Cronobacter muytjensii]CCJ72642.1 Putative inner membrane protein [Cronobacter condimenti 1330]
MTRIVLLISFLFFFGRFIYSAVGAWYHHQDKVQAQQISMTLDSSSQQQPR